MTGIRPAAPADAVAVARLLVEAGGGLVEHVSRRVAPGSDPVALMAALVEDPLSPYSFRNCFVTIDGDEITAAVNVYPAEAFRPDPGVIDRLSPADRARLAPLYETRVEGSLYLSGMAVAYGHRGEGLGRLLMGEVFATAQRLGRREVSLMVWADNVNVVRFYAASGFLRRRIVPLDLAPELPHKGGMFLMVAPVPEPSPHAPERDEGIIA
ncbi:MAG: GNAT family N-acetyltransferase [Nitrospinae bacterium]|nr:GNAT family N-acetyltransferase [Nitrospinota bacterium]